MTVQAAVVHYLRDLRATFSTNVHEARRMLSLARDKIVLRVEGE